MGSARFLPLQVAAVCYRRRGASFDFLLVKTTSGDRWTFPKGATARRLSHSQAAEREALEEAGAVGVIEPQHFHLYLQPKRRLQPAQWRPGIRREGFHVGSHSHPASSRSKTQ